MRHIRSLSRWVNEPLPTTCAHPDCGHVFQGAAFKGYRTGKLYCSRACRDDMSDEVKIEDAARSVN